MSPGKTRTFHYWQTRTLVATIVGYALFYFVRKNFSMAMPGMEAELGISKTKLGIFLTLNGVFYGLSRFANSFLADFFNARLHMAIGLALCAAANFAFGYGVDIASWLSGGTSGPGFSNALVLFMGLLWLANGALQGMGYPPCVRLLTHWIPPGELATKMSIWNTSHSIGAGLVLILCGYIMSNMGVPGTHAGAWKWCFWMPAGIAMAGAVFLFVALRDTPASVGLPELGGTAVKLKKTTGKPADYWPVFFEKVLRNPLIWTICAANFFVYVVRFSVLDWGPTLLQQSKGVSLAVAGWLVALSEVSGIAGILVAGWVTDRFLQGRAHRTCVFYMAGVTLVTLVFWQIPHGAPAWMLFATLCPLGFFVYGPQALLGVAAANQATRKAAARANGVAGIFGYASTGVSGMGFGYVAEHYGWNAAYITIIGMALLGMFTLMLMWRAKAHGYEETSGVNS